MSDSQSPLQCFTAKGQLDDLSLFRPHISSWNSTNAKGNTLLHLAARCHRLRSRTIPELLKLGLYIDQKKIEGQASITYSRIDLRNGLTMH